MITLGQWLDILTLVALFSVWSPIVSYFISKGMTLGRLQAIKRYNNANKNRPTHSGVRHA